MKFRRARDRAKGVVPRRGVSAAGEAPIRFDPEPVALTQEGRLIVDQLSDEDRRIIKALSDGERRIIERALPYTMTGVPRLVALLDAVRYCVRRGVPGAFAECGVWRGGSVLAMVLALTELGVSDREIYLYDTFEGMTEPQERDTSPFDPSALEIWNEAEGRPWPELFDEDVFNEEAVRATLIATGYAGDRLHFVRGRVEETLPDHAPATLALLRLDTDWYESTRHELLHLYPRLSKGGVLIVDDYGHWEGCRQAVDEFLTKQGTPVLMNRIDYAARMLIKE